MTSKNAPPLGIPAVVLALCFASLLGSTGIILYQLHLRSDVFLSGGLRIFYLLFMFHDYPAAVIAVGAVLLGLIPVSRSAGIRFVESVALWPRLVLVLAFAGFAAGAFWVYHAYPLCMDEYAPYLQA